MTVRLERDGAIAVITIDRPERRNAVDHPTLLRLLDMQRELAADAPRGVRAVVLTGAPPAFSAGADLNGVEAGQFATDLRAVLCGFGTLPVPVIAAIDGPALGAGTQLAVACDVRVATPQSKLGIPAAKLGISVDHWTIRRVAQEFTAPVARAMLVATEIYTAERLYSLGGIHRLGSLDDAVAWAHELSKLAPLTAATHKLGIESVDLSEPMVEEFESARVATWASNDAEEGRAAFLGKRPAAFTGS